jgi:hypothetical protein
LQPFFGRSGPVWWATDHVLRPESDSQMAIPSLDPRAISKMRARAKDLAADHPDLVHAQRLDIVARDHGFASWKEVRRTEKTMGLQPTIDNPEARRLLERAHHLGASTIHMTVKQDWVDVRMRVHGQLIDHQSIQPAAVDELIEACADTESAPVVGGVVHVIHLPRPQLTWLDMQPGPVARQVVEWWATNPNPGVLLVSSFSVDPVFISEPLLNYAKGKAMSGAWKVNEYRCESESDPLAVGPKLKSVVPLRASNCEASIKRALFRKLPAAMLAGDHVFSVCVSVDTLPHLCPHCAVAPKEGDRTFPREMEEGLRNFVASLPRAARLRQRGKGCPRCNGIGTVGTKYLFEGHGITEGAIEAAVSRDWSRPAWMETIEGNFSHGKIVTISALVAEAAAAGEVDVFSAFERLGELRA